MNIDKFQKEIQRTLPDLSNKNVGKLLNSIHMTLGMATEFEELINAWDNNDIVNVKEEIGDLEWYLINYATIHNIEIKIKKQFEFDSHILLKYICMLIDMDKRELAYDAITDENKRAECFNELLGYIESMAYLQDIDMYEVRQKIVDKLYKRYPVGFSNEKALNRNLEEERKVLENE